MRLRTLLSLAVAALAACGVSKDEFAAAQRDAAQSKQKYQEETEKTAALEKKVTDLEKNVADLQGQLAAAHDQQQTLQLTQAKLQEEKSTLEAKSAQYEQLNKSLQKEIDSGQIEISELRGRMTVKLKDQILFPSGSAALNKDGRKALDAVADALKNVSGKSIVVAGYTDDVPTGSKSAFKDNWDLSTARAVSVVRYLQSKGVSPEALGAAGFAEYRPIAPNDSPQNRSVNRRIEIGLTAVGPAEDVGQKQ